MGIRCVFFGLVLVGKASQSLDGVVFISQANDVP
jgi:hypothetical protein